MDNHTEIDDQKPQAIELVKKWHRTGFISVSYWAYADKVIIEIGATDPDNGNALKGATKCFLPAPQFLSYLHAEVHGTIERIYSDFTPTGKGVSFFGGTISPVVISRIFNSKVYLDYKNNNAPDFFFRTFTCAHYEGTTRDKGVVIPNYKAEISRNTMKLSLIDIAEIYHLVNTQMIVETMLDAMVEHK